jgi:hypothetical protein
MKKLSVLLGLRDKTEKSWQAMLDDMFGKFKNKQGLFKGFRRTYVAIDTYADDPTKRGYEQVASTVKEQLTWFKDHVLDHFNITFAVEKTNASGVTVDLIVDGNNWGKYSTLELLRLKSILDSKMKAMVAELPIRKETTIWTPTTDENYNGRDIFQSPLDEGYAKTTLKRVEIIQDPHIKEAPNRAPVTQQIDTQVNIGKYTNQDFSGEFTNKQRADIQVKYDKLYTAVIESLETANNTEIQESDLGQKVLDYLF